MSLFDQPLPYCGAPPRPSTLWLRWNLDPVLLAVLLAIAIAYAVAWRASPGGRARPAPARVGIFYTGWALGSLALISPLCALSVSLFSARIAQHTVLTLVAAPLVMAGRPLATLWTARLRAGPGRGSPPRAALRLWAAAAVFALLLWFWHAPGPYALTFTSTLVYWTMHVTLIGSALWLWGELLRSAQGAALNAAAGSLASSVQMGFLGAVITLAPRLLYTPHLLTTAAWGLTPLQDQQLGGVIMWVPGCAVFLVVTVASLWRLLATAGSPATHWSAPPGAELGHAATH